MRSPASPRPHIDGQRKTVEKLRAQIASSGFMVPTRMKRAGCWKLILALDDVDAHRRRVEQQVHDMIIQQVHFVRRDPRLAAANTPDQWRSPFWIAFSMSSVPTTRSSVALTGRSTGACGARSPAAHRPAPAARGIRRTGGRAGVDRN